MSRRRLALYTLLYIAGITAGYFMFERSRMPDAAGFITAVISAVLLTSQSRSERSCDITDGSLTRQKTILITIFLGGFLLFAVRSQMYSYGMACIQDKDCIRGKVISASIKDEKIRFIIKNSGKGPSRVLVTLDRDATKRFAGRYAERRPEMSAGSQTYDIHAESEDSLRSAASSCIGSTVEARGEYTEIAQSDDPGCFDYSLYMKSRGVGSGFKACIIEETETTVSKGTELKRSLNSARESFISSFDDETQGFIRGVIFGDKSEIGEDTLEEFNSNSTGHILAVSGLHIGFLYGLLRFLTARKRTLPVSVLIIAVIFLYGEMTMWSPATVRACIVMTISLAGTHLRRHSDLLTSISLAALLILTYQPYQLFNSGFQLSFLALCGIAFLTGPISSVTGETLAVMLAVQAGTLPVIAYSYCRINPLSILINVPVIFLASVLVPLCILLLMMEVLAAWVPAAGADLAELISCSVIKVNHFLAFGGDFSIKTAGPGAAAIILIYITVFGLASEWTRVMLLRKEPKAVLKQGILLMMPLAMLFSCLYDPISDDEIVFVAVGQGDCVHIREEGHDVLIDGGGQASYGSSDPEEDPDPGYNIGKNILMPYLMHSGSDAVDIALVTHLHADHYKGIEELSEVFPVGAIGIPADYRGALNTYGDDAGKSSKPAPDEPDDPTKIYLIKPGTEVDISENVSIEVIWPVEESKEPVAADDPNEHNTVYMVNYKGTRVMVTGDLLEEDEQKMVKYYRDTDTLKCDILKVAHHGSKSSSCEEFLDAAAPGIAVIQCGRNNFYGHPHKQTLERLEERGIRVFRTDISGAVGIDIHDTRLSVDLFRRNVYRN